ncbi:MAG: tetratricopeptide repeat protein [Acidobacteria bacterium]|nr:tetratricopeptide repeat protein [Acidobacteriota bacterium]
MATAQKHIEQAKAFLAANRFSEAENELRQAIKLDRKEVPARVELARLLGMNGQLEECEQIVDQALDISPSDSDALTLKGMNLIMREQYESAIEVLQKALEGNPKQLMAQVHLGLALRETDHIEESETILRKAVSSNPRSAQALFELAHTLAVKQRDEEALRMLMQLVKTHPNFTRGYIAIAGLYRNADRLDDAIKICHQGLSTNPRAFEIASLLKDLYWESRDIKSSLHVMGMICDHRGLTDDFIELGEMAAAANRPEVAEKSYKKAIEQSPEDWIAYSALGEFYDSINEVEKAEEAFHLSIQYNTANSYRPHNGLGMLYTKQDSIEQAIEQFRKACFFAPGEAGPRFNLGLALAKIDLLEDAQEELKIALDHVGPGEFRNKISQVLEAVERELKG